MFNWMFASAYEVYAKSENFDARLRAISVLVLFQFGILILAGVIFNPIKDRVELQSIRSEIIVSTVLLIFLLFFLNFLYYNRKRTKVILTRFRSQKDWVKRCAKLITLLLFFLPILIAIIFSQRQLH